MLSRAIPSTTSKLLPHFYLLSSGDLSCDCMPQQLHDLYLHRLALQIRANL